MSQIPGPDSEAVCALILDDVMDLVGRGQAKSTVLLAYQDKWMQAGASLGTCKVVRLLVAMLGARQQGQASGLNGAEFASQIRFAMTELAAGDREVAGDSPSPTAEGRGDVPLALIMKGGGIKGLAYVGALDLLAERYRFNWYVGTSAGAVTAVLLGAGFSPGELREILKEKNFKDFFDAPWWLWPLNLIAHHGIHQADSFTDWLDVLL